MKHTPGPWKIRFMGDEKNPDDGFFVEARNNNMPELGYGIEIMMDDFGDHNGYPARQRLADARLIAASPDLLEALEGILDIGKRDMSNPKYDAYFKSAKEAIKKARQK